MDAQDWHRIVFRIRNLPSHVSSLAEASRLVGRALNIPVEHVLVYSLARTSDIWDDSLCKVATAQFETLPPSLRKTTGEDEWSIPLPEGAPGQVLLLDTHFKGMTVLNDVDPPTTHRADCIAISGLASHPFGSWQPRGRDKTFMWIRDALPRLVPGIRSIIYGYDSSLTRSDSFQSISDIAQSLVFRLKSGGWNSPSAKPIIFLAHSLGGLVLKEAFVEMADSNAAVSSVLDNVMGTIMFGVPSLGMEQRHLMTMAEGEANEFLLQDLSRENGGNYVRQLNKRFESLSFLRTTPVYWAYETKLSPTVKRRPSGTWERTGTPAVLVNLDSATCYHWRKNKSMTIPINEDHANMVKFSKGHADLGTIIHLIDELCDPAHRQHRNADGHHVDAPEEAQTKPPPDPGVPSAIVRDTEGERKLEGLGNLLSSIDSLQTALDSSELELRINQVSEPFVETFEWIFDLPVFSTWVQEWSGPKLFWIRGKPGSGKSTLMKFILQNKQTWELFHNPTTASLEITAAFFFHYRGTAIQKSFEGILRGLITRTLVPHYVDYQAQHRPTWDKYRALREQRKTSESRKKTIEDDLRKIEVKLGEYDGEPSAAVAVKHIEAEQHVLRRELRAVDGDIKTVNSTVRSLAAGFAPYYNIPTANFLRSVAKEYQKGNDGLIAKLERVLRRILDQDTTKVDLLLFFDALDEFDGSLHMISRFLKGLVQPSRTSKTRVKVCFSGRDWKTLKEHFSTYPGITLQDHTRHDMETYAAGSLVSSRISHPAIVRIIPAVIARANGVFLWVRLALGELFEMVKSDPNASPQALEERLWGLPDDLSEFYKRIVERISASNRRKAFCLLELLVRLQGSHMSTVELRDAVLISDCRTFEEAQDALAIAHAMDGDEESRYEKIWDEISTWGGGLVEIKQHGLAGRAQLMHQTVFEFVASIPFKRIVLGDSAVIIDENGHSFHLKYWSLQECWAKKNVEAVNGLFEELVSFAPPRGRYQFFAFTYRSQETLERLAYHAQQSEATTGSSHFDFLYSIPFIDQAPIFFEGRSWNRDNVFISLVASCGLALCLKDWIAKNPPKALGRLVSASSGTPWDFPTIGALVLAPLQTNFNDGLLVTLRLLLENGYDASMEPRLVSLLCEQLWRNSLLSSQSATEQEYRIPDSALLTIIVLALQHGWSPDAPANLYGRDTLLQCRARALHVAPPALAEELIHNGADPNLCDSEGFTPLDWALVVPYHVSQGWNLARRYEMCSILLKAGGAVSSKTPRKVWQNALAEFKKQGFGIQSLQERLTAQGPERHRQGGAASRRVRPWLGIFQRARSDDK
ncbi:uncharacterized protein B0H64DRAFT_368987 [Chaetomium fimeti]|uniref:Nephrocystin 3-like N-terminal domain-containing protein n=1 Tax=Chaetomium fimeti TaxID=1854472 RepID=A0AAE0H559_9PEZI|nr:hypothetical protein B0H64DRAFT_368987 [Chaetomium fimeti]